MATRAPGDTRTYRFGPFELDTGRRRLSRGGRTVSLGDRDVDVLLVLVAHAGDLVEKEAIHVAGWGVLAVTDNSIAQVIKRLRQALGTQADGTPYIQNAARRGYRFVGDVAVAPAPTPSVDLDAVLEPYRVFIDGRAALESLSCDAVSRACEAFEAALRVRPDSAAAHMGMANACVLAFETMRIDAAPDRELLTRAEEHGREACRLDPSSGDAWSTLAIVRHRHGDYRDAVGAARRAVELEPRDWRHALRLAWVSWGHERIRAAHRVLERAPEVALAHWFSATVCVACDDLNQALDDLRTGCRLQDAQREHGSPFAAVGLHLLHGLVLAAKGCAEESFAALEHELSFENSGHVYARESCANTWYAIGALHLRQGRPDAAHAAFEQALERVPGHGLAMVGGRATSSSAPVAVSRDVRCTVDEATVYAAVLALEGKLQDAAWLCGETLKQAPRGSAGWMIPVDPLLHVSAHRDAWALTLSLLRQRAS